MPYAKKCPNTFPLRCTCFGAKSTVGYSGGPTQRTAKETVKKTDLTVNTAVPDPERFSRWMSIGRYILERKNASEVVNQIHTLFYLAIPRGQPIEIQTEGPQPRLDWRRCVYPQKIYSRRKGFTRGRRQRRYKNSPVLKTGLKY